MGRQLGKYTFFLIAGYIAVSQFTGTTKVISAGASGGSQVFKTLQGR